MLPRQNFNFQNLRNAILAILMDVYRCHHTTLTGNSVAQIFFSGTTACRIFFFEKSPLQEFFLVKVPPPLRLFLIIVRPLVKESAGCQVRNDTQK